jgi:hypothetical protein
MERDDDQPTGKAAQPPAPPEHAHLGCVDDVAHPQGEHGDGGADRLTDGHGGEHGADVLEPIHRRPPADQPLEDDHRQERPGHVARRLGERGPQRQQRELPGEQVPEQDPGPPAQATQVQHRDAHPGGRPEGTRRARQQERLAALGGGVVADSDQQHPGRIPQRPSGDQQAPPGRLRGGERCVGVRPASDICPGPLGKTVPPCATRVERDGVAEASASAAV